MRDNSDGMPEIIDSFKEGANFFAVVSLTIHGATKLVQFGVDAAGHAALKKILAMRPFDSLPGVRYRYFFGGGMRRVDEFEIELMIRVEQGTKAKKFPALVPNVLASNFQWLFQAESWEEFSHLVVGELN